MKMASPDYAQRAEDHQSLLILVKQIGTQISNKTFNKVFERISRTHCIKVQDSQGTGVQRIIWLRYKKFYPVENNEWGDFQAHRKVLGLISIGKCTNQAEIEELCKHHNVQREKYSQTLYDSRCLVFCASPESPESSQGGSEKVSPDDQNTCLLGDSKAHSGNCSPSSCTGSDENIFKPYEDLVPKVQDNTDDRDSGVYEQISLSNDAEPSMNDRVKESISQPSDGLGLVFKDESSSSSLINNMTNASKDSSPSEGEGIQSASPSSTTSTSSPLGSPMSLSIPSVNVTDVGTPSSPAGSRKLMIPPTVKSRSTHCILYNSVDDCDQLEQDMYEFASSLFWVLESKRLDRSFEKQDKVPLLMASFEKKTLVGLDTDTRSYKKRCLGRMRKHIGDLALLAGLPNEALSLYTMGVDTLKAINDWLWLASAYEGLCAASIIMQYPHQLRNTSLHRNSSCPVNHSPCVTKSKSGSLSSHTRSLPNGMDPAESKMIGKSILSADEIVDKYKEAINHYSKYVQAQVLEIECSMKAARVLTLQEKYLTASEFIKNALFINLQSNEDCTQRFCALAQLYTEIGFHRKSAFLKRVSAMRSVPSQASNPNWNQCYHLLLQTLEGYRVTLDPKEFQQDHPCGWPGIQVQILQELVEASKRMNNQSLAVRHMTFLLQTMFQYLTPAERKDYCAQLESLTSKCEGAPVPLTLDNGIVIPPVNLLNFPNVRSFKPINLAPHLRPIKIEDKAKTPTMGPFIFTPLKFHKDKSPENGTKLNFKWVEGCVCAVALQVYNPLPFELNVNHMGLLADGIVFESFPASLSLPAESGPYPAQLLGTPHSTGELQILGYTSHVLGVKSNCRLCDMPAIGKQLFSIDVVPALPLIQVTTSLQKGNTFSSLKDTSNIVFSGTATLYAGESRECTITITNTGKEMVESIDIALQTKMDKTLEEEYFTWSKENLDMQLPIAPGSTASFTLYINALGDFVNNNSEPDAQRSATSSPAHSKGKASRPSTTNCQDLTQKRRPTNVISPEPFPPKIVEAVLQLQYSGGPGIKAGYCRQCAVAVTVEIQPSVVITKWDVLPAEVPNQCYLVLDVLNATSHEMELHYATNKQIFIEARETCRIPVPVERCTLQFSQLELQDDESGGSSVEPKRAVTSLENICREHLVNLVDLRWTLPGLDISGRASIAEVTWTTSMLDVIVMSPVQWEIELNDKPYKQEEEFSFIVGELIMLNIAIRNLSDSALESLWLCIQGYQDYQNGHQNYSLNMHRTVVGCDKVMINEISPQETFSHKCGFLFFHTGVYKLDIQCSSTRYQDVSRILTVQTSAKCPSKDYTGRGGSDQSRYTWKCTPSIEIAIIEK